MHGVPGQARNTGVSVVLTFGVAKSLLTCAVAVVVAAVQSDVIVVLIAAGVFVAAHAVIVHSIRTRSASRVCRLVRGNRISS